MGVQAAKAEAEARKKELAGALQQVLVVVLRASVLSKPCLNTQALGAARERALTSD